MVAGTTTGNTDSDGDGLPDGDEVQYGLHGQVTDPTKWVCTDRDGVQSDGSTQVRGRGFPHPRSYGTFPRVIGRYVREKGVLRLEEAIRKMTSLPAQVLRLKDRGYIREGMWADVVVFDPGTFEDTATFENPHQLGRGLAFTVVNGQVVFAEGKWTGRLPGRPLYGKGRKT